jgi:hypothetical protein
MIGIRTMAVEKVRKIDRKRHCSRAIAKDAREHTKRFSVVAKTVTIRELTKNRGRLDISRAFLKLTRLRLSGNARGADKISNSLLKEDMPSQRSGIIAIPA